MADEHNLEDVLEDVIENGDLELELPADDVLHAAHGPVLDAAKGIGEVLDGLPGGDTYIPPQNDRPPPGAPPKAI